MYKENSYIINLSKDFFLNKKTLVRMKKKYSQKSMELILLSYLQLSIFMILLPIFWMNLSANIYQVIVLLVFIECVFVSFVDRIFNIYQIFLFMIFLFSIALPVFELFGWYSYPPNNMIMYTTGVEIFVSSKTLAITYKILITMLLGTSFGWLIGMLKFNLYNKKREYSLSNVIEKSRNLFKYLFFILLPLVTLHTLILVYYTTMFGYVEVMHLHSVNLNISSILSFSSILYKMSGYAILFQSRNRKEYVKYAVIFMIPFLIQIGTGARGETVAIIITVLFIYSYYFKQVKLKKILPVSIIVFILANVVGSYRFTGDIRSGFSDISIFKWIVSGIVSNARSMGVIAYTIELKDHFFNKVPFLFGYIQGIFSFAPNYTYEGIQNKNYLAQHITYLIDPNKLYRGSTIGTSLGAEFYELSNGNMIIIFILSIVLLFFACYFIKKLFKNQFMFYLGAIFIECLCMSPRGSIMKIFSKETVFSMVILIFIILLPQSRKCLYQRK